MRQAKLIKGEREGTERRPVPVPQERRRPIGCWGSCLEPISFWRWEMLCCSLTSMPPMSGSYLNSFAPSRPDRTGSCCLRRWPSPSSRTDYDALSSHMDVVEQLGFLVEDFGSCTVLVREAPMWIEDQDVQSCILGDCRQSLPAEKGQLSGVSGLAFPLYGLPCGCQSAGQKHPG